jgi:hypothetical protein
MNKSLLLFLCYLLVAILSKAQFIDATIEMGTPTITDDPWYGHGVCLVDVNKDGWDDVTCCTYANGIYVYEKTTLGWTRRNIVPPLGNAKCAVWGDYDRDGDFDLFVTYRFANMRLFRNDGNWVFTDVSISAGLSGFPVVATWGACWEDYNRDGWLDLFVVNYDAAANSFNRCLRNNGDGTFTDVASTLGLQGGGTFPFMPCFFKANHDSYNDLMVCVDFQPSDRLFFGNAMGTFTDVSNTCGLNFSVNNMTSSPGDFDLDGDFDLFITNTPGVGSFMYLNNGSGFFSNSPSYVAANINAWTWGASWLDYNNDRNLDIVVASQSSNGLSSLYLLRNNVGAFQDITPDILKFVPNSNYAVCKGDVNRDGYPDIFLNVEDGGYNRLYINTQSENNFVKLEFEGVQSNLNGFGTYLEAYVDGVKIINQLRGGEQYLSQNSQHLIIPLKLSQQIDSLIVKWPSGQIDRYYNIPKNKHYHLVEGNTSPIQLIGTNQIFCEGSSAIVAAANGQNVAWNSGQTSTAIQLTTTSIAFGIQADSRNIYWFTDSIQVQSVIAQSVQFEITPPSCFSDSLAQVCLTSESVSFLGETNPCRSDLSSGQHDFVVLNNGCVDTLNVEIPSIEIPLIDFEVEQPSCLNNNLGRVQIVDSIWSFSANQVAENLTPGSYQFQVFFGWCESEISAQIQSAELFSVQVETTHPNCFNNPNTGSITLISDSLTWYTLLYETDTIYQGLENQFDSLPGGVYSLISENQLGCLESQQIQLEIPNQWWIEASVNPVACAGDSSGSVELVVNGNSSALDILLTSESGFDLNTNSLSISNLPVGLYSVSCRDTIGCMVSTNFEISEPAPLICQIDSSNWIGAFPFELAVLASGGTPPYTYQWSNACADSSCMVVESGEISIIVADSNGCSDQLSWFAPTSVEEVEQIPFTISAYTLSLMTPRWIKIYNLTGQVLFEGYTNEYVFKNQGIYFLSIEKSWVGEGVFKVKI